MILYKVFFIVLKRVCRQNNFLGANKDRHRKYTYIMKQPGASKFSVFVDLMPVIESNRQAKIQLYDLLAKLNTYDHIERIFVLNNPVDKPEDVPGSELYHNSDDTKKQYYMFNQMAGSRDFFNKVLNIDQNYKLNQAIPSDIVYITSQDNHELGNLRQIYAQILNPNVITIKLDTSRPGLANTSITEFADFLSLSGKPLGVRITRGALPSNMQAKVLSYVDKFRTQDPSRIVAVYPAADKYHTHGTDRALFNMYLTDSQDLDARITSVTNATMARFLVKLLTVKSLEHKPVKSRKGRMVSGLRRFTRKLLGKVSSRRKQALDMNKEFASRKPSERTSKRPTGTSSKTIKPLGNNEDIASQLEYAAKYLAEIERLDTLIAESGKSRQQKQKSVGQRSIIEDIHRRYRTHRIAYIRAIRNLFSYGPGTAKSRLHAIYRQAERPKTKKLIERILRMLDDKDAINNMRNTIDTKALKREYANTIRQNIAANPGFFKKLTRKRILSQLSTIG